MRRYFCICMIALLILTGCSKKQAIEPITQVQLTQLPVNLATLSHDAALTLLLIDDHLLQVWDNQSQQLMKQIEGSKYQLTFRDALIAPSKRSIVSISDTQLNIWQLHTNEIVSYSLPEFDSSIRITKAQWSSDEQLIALGYNDGSVLLLSLDKQTITKIHLHESSVTHLIFNRSLTSLYSASLDGHAKRLELQSKEITIDYALPHRITSLALSQNENRLFVSDALQAQELIDTRSGEPVLSLSYPQRFKFFRGAQFLASDEFLLTTSSKAYISLWELVSGTEIISWPIAQRSAGSTVYDFHLSDSNVLTTISSDGMLEKWAVTPILFAPKRQ
ncbi:WD40 repeat domain-containing protein [Pseudoalteromonas peptidolytica]|nr:WD40 repeat domain-containing protein [Pseudoalteromonas peptidolytica]NLR16231.1 WD40 repeat domain-containing protein [Pseudoalteromonas peptidolytica]GEK11813.1 hypothetical protein PPE03_40620 [Pseudoalteromonas peptidolytica]